jgi:hypothetical protein
MYVASMHNNRNWRDRYADCIPGSIVKTECLTPLLISSLNDHATRIFVTKSKPWKPSLPLWHKTSFIRDLTGSWDNLWLLAQCPAAYSEHRWQQGNMTRIHGWTMSHCKCYSCMRWWCACYRIDGRERQLCFAIRVSFYLRACNGQV